MKQLRYIGKNRPEGMVIEVEEKDLKRLLDSGEWEETSKPKLEIKIEKEVKYNGISNKHTK